MEIDPWVTNQLLRVVRVALLKSATFTTDGFVGGQAELKDVDECKSVTTDGAGNASIVFPVAFRTECVRVLISSGAATHVKITARSKTGFSINGPVGATFLLDYSARGA
jgi:hypothetical protein